MRWNIYFFLLITTLCLVLASFTINEKSREIHEKIKTTQNEIDKYRDDLGRLRAEWAFLTRPERIACLTEFYFDELGLVPITSYIFADLDTIPYIENEIPVTSAMTASLTPNLGVRPVYYKSMSNNIIPDNETSPTRQIPSLQNVGCPHGAG